MADQHESKTALRITDDAPEVRTPSVSRTTPVYDLALYAPLLDRSGGGEITVPARLRNRCLLCAVVFRSLSRVSLAPLLPCAARAPPRAFFSP